MQRSWKDFALLSVELSAAQYSSSDRKIELIVKK